MVVRQDIGNLGPLDKSNESWRATGVVIGETIGGAITSVIEKVRGLIGWFRDAAKSIGGFFSNLGGILKTPMIGGGAKAPFVSGSVAGARAAGGPVRRGSTHLVGERGPELWRTPTSGSITNTMDTVRAIKAQALAGAAQAGGGAVTNVGGITIHVQAAPGQSAQSIADTVERRLSERLNALSRGAFSDGVY